MEKMNEHLYIAHKKLPHKTLRVHSARERENSERYYTETDKQRETERQTERQRETERENSNSKTLIPKEVAFGPFGHNSQSLLYILQETERDRDRERHRDRGRDRDTDRKTKTQRDRDTERQ